MSLSEERTELLLSWRHSGFSVHTGVRVEPEDSAAVERLARYILRPPISLERMRWSGEGEVGYRRKGGHDGGPAEPREVVETFDHMDFLARVIMHVPEPRRHLVRYYGAYSNVSRGRRKRFLAASSDEASGVDSEMGVDERGGPPNGKALRRRWRELIKRIYEVDPLVCPSCGGGMKIIAFILDHTVVDATLRHLEGRARAGRGRGPPGRTTLEVAS